MRKSSKCRYKIGLLEKNKKKFLKPEEAIAECEKLNAQPNTIRKYIPYKCTTCHFFHIGRSSEQNVKQVDIFKQPEIQIKVEITIISPAVEPIPPHDDFDWESDKRIL